MKEPARKLRKQEILSEVLLWKKIKNKSQEVGFHGQVPIEDVKKGINQVCMVYK